MRDIADKADNTPGATGQLTAAEYNDRNTELQGSVEQTQQVLDINKPDQLGRSMFIYATGAQSCDDAAPGANVIELTPRTGTSGLRIFDSYSQADGCILAFTKTTANDSSTVTVNVGQSGGGLLGAKSLKKVGGDDPEIGEIFGYTKIRFSVSSDYWEIIETGNPNLLSNLFISADTTIVDNDGVEIITSDASITRVTVTLPALANNIGREITIKTIAAGITRLLRAGSDVIDDGESDQTEISLHNKGDNITVVGVQTGASTYKWVITKLKDRIESGFVNRSDWTNVEIGTVSIDVTGGSSPSLGYEIGELVSDGGGGSGRIINILDNTDGTGTITVYDCTGGGNFITTNTLTGGNSGATSTVNGNTKNTDDNFYHGRNVELGQTHEYFYISSTTNYNGSPSVEFASLGAISGDRGFQIYGITDNTFKLQTGSSGGFYVSETGVSTNLATQDWYYNLISERII